jgi:hypothetical protein
MMSAKEFFTTVVGLLVLTMPVNALAGGHHDFDSDDARPFAWHDQGRHRGWFKHQGHIGAIEDEDEDEDECEHRLAPPYRGSSVRRYYGGRSDLAARRRQLLVQLDNAQAQFYKARIRGQRKLSARWASYIHYLNQQISGIDAEAGYGYAPPVYASAPPADYLPSPYGGDPYSSYGAYPYGSGPMNPVVSSLLGPMLGAVP